jgi:O-antigen ligase
MPQNSLRLDAHPAAIPARIPPVLWIGFILAAGIIIPMEPLWSAVVVTVAAFGLVFTFLSITKPRWALALIIVVGLMFPVRLFIVQLTEFAYVDICSILNVWLLLILFTVNASRGQLPISKSPLDGWFVAVVLLAIPNCVFSRDVPFTVHAWQHILLVGPLAYFLVYHHFSTGDQVRRLFHLVMAIMVITGLYLLLEYALKYNPLYHQILMARSKWYDPFTPYYRASGFSGMGNLTGVAFTVIVPLAIFGFQHAATGGKRLSWGIISLILILGALASFSRATTLALFFAIVLMMIRSWKWLIIGLLVLIALIAVMFQAGLFETLLIRLDPRFFLHDNSIWHRILMFGTTWNIFLDHPIVGAGLSSVFKLYPYYKHPLDFLDYGVVDNQFLTFLYGTGIIGVIIFGGLLIKIPYQLRKFRWRQQFPLTKHFRRAAIVSIIVFYINCLNSEAFDWVVANLTFWLIVAILMRLTTLPNDQIKRFFRIYGYQEDSSAFSINNKPPT